MLKHFLKTLLLSLLVCGVSLFFFAYTQTGLQTSAKLVQVFLGKHLVSLEVEGNLAEHLVIKRLLYRNEEYQLLLEKFSLDWQLLQLFRHGHITIEKVEAAKLILKLPSRRKSSVSFQTSLKKIQQIYRYFNFKQLQVAHLTLVNQYPIEIRQLQLKSDKLSSSLKKLQANISYEKLSAQLTGYIQLHPSLYWNFELITAGQLPRTQHNLAAKITVNGNPDKLVLQFLSQKPFASRFTADLKNFFYHPSWAIQANWEGLSQLLPTTWSLQADQGEFKTKGSWENYQFHLKTQAKLTQGSQHTCQLYGTGDLTGLTITPIKLILFSLPVNGEIKLKWAKHDVIADLHLMANRLLLPNTETYFNQVDLRAQGSLKKKINFLLTAHQQNSNLSAQGWLAALGNHLSAEFQLIGKNLQIINTAEYKITASPNLQFQLHHPDLNIKGDIFVPQANIQHYDFSHTIELPTDVVFENSQQASSQKVTFPFRISQEIQVKLGDKIHLTTHGIEASLQGQLRIYQIPPQAIRANGEIHIVKGRYRAYGQNLKIEQGQLIYVDEPLDSPHLNLRASKKFAKQNTLPSFLNTLAPRTLTTGSANTVKAGIIVAGDIKEPEVKLFSLPALSNADILSYLTLGRPTDQISGTDSSLLLNALLAINPSKNANLVSQLQQELTQKLGLDINIGSAAVRDEDTGDVLQTTAIILGKALGPNLYLSYTYAIKTADYLVKMRYALNQHWAVQTETDGNENGIDILFTQQRQ